MNRRSAIACSFALALLLAPVANAADAPVMQPGLWEVTIRSGSSESAPKTVTQACITKAQTENLAPAKKKKTDDCQVTGALTGNLLKYSVKCGHKNATTDVEFTYSGDRYEGTVKIKADDVLLTQYYSARRIGECPAEE